MWLCQKDSAVALQNLNFQAECSWRIQFSKVDTIPDILAGKSSENTVFKKIYRNKARRCPLALENDYPRANAISNRSFQHVKLVVITWCRPSSLVLSKENRSEEEPMKFQQICKCAIRGTNNTHILTSKLYLWQYWVTEPHHKHKSPSQRYEMQVPGTQVLKSGSKSINEMLNCSNCWQEKCFSWYS
jgi:hypothetical protein